MEGEFCETAEHWKWVAFLCSNNLVCSNGSWSLSCILLLLQIIKWCVSIIWLRAKLGFKTEKWHCYILSRIWHGRNKRSKQYSQGYLKTIPSKPVRNPHNPVMHMLLGLKKEVVCFLKKEVFTQKNPYPEVYSALPTLNYRKTCIKHPFLMTKIIVCPKNRITNLPTLFFLWTVTGNKHFFSRPYRNNQNKQSFKCSQTISRDHLYIETTCF